jgi:hypothetical protein
VIGHVARRGTLISTILRAAMERDKKRKPTIIDPKHMNLNALRDQA